MAEPLKIRRLSSVIAAVLTFIVFSLNILEIDDPPNGIEICKSKQCPIRNIDAIEYLSLIDENRPNRRNNASSSFQKNSILHELFFTEIYGLDAYLSELSVQTVKTLQFSKLKNDVQIKLRI